MFISYLIFAWSVFHFKYRVLILSLILSGSLSELPETFTLGIILLVRKNKTDKLHMIVRVLILKTFWWKTIIYFIQKKECLDKNNNKTGLYNYFMEGCPAHDMVAEIWGSWDGLLLITLMSQNSSRSWLGMMVEQNVDVVSV